METDFSSEENPPSPEADTGDGAEGTAPADTPGGDEEASAIEGAEKASDPLTALAERASKGRLPAAEEERATQLLSAALLGSRDDVARSVELLPNLPWVIAVNGVTAAWPEMKPTMRNRLLAGLGRLETDAARRVRLSLARGLFKLDPAVSTKIAVTVAKEMRDKETGAVSAKNAQIFSNVLIGRARPWIAQLPLQDLKAADADALVQSALTVVFLQPHTPVTQLGVLKWSSEAGKLAKINPAAAEAITKGLARWSAKWQASLLREVNDLPESILIALKTEAPPPASPPVRSSDTEVEDEVDDEERDEATGGTTQAGDRQDVGEAPAETKVKQRPVYESKTVPPRDRGRERDRDRERERKPATAASFHLGDTLRLIETHVAGLRSELSAAQSKLRQRDEDPRRGKKPDRAPVIPGEPTADELARLNVQLEARNAELQQRIEELAVDSEDRAASMGIASGEPIQDDDIRLRQLLVLKLQDDFEDFLALESESPDVVVPKHYRTVLQHVFEVLAAEGVLSPPAPPPA